MSVHRTYQNDISKVMSLTAIPKENWNDAWRNLAQDTVRWKKLTKKWLAKQRQEEKNKVWSKQAEITPGGKTFHRAEKQRDDQQRAAEENLTVDEAKRIECPHCRSKFAIGKFFVHRKICGNLSSTERNRQNNSRIRRREKLAKREDIPAAQPPPVAQPEQRPLEQQEDEIEWKNIMNEVDAIFSEPVAVPHPEQRDRAAPNKQARGKWRNMSAMPAPKRPAGQNPLECTFCHSGSPKADKCAIHMRTCASMPYDMWIARVRLSSVCPDYAEPCLSPLWYKVCDKQGAVMRMRINVAKEEKKVDYPWAHVFGTRQQRMRRNCDDMCKVLAQQHMNAMCELSATEVSDSEESEDLAAQNTINNLLEAVSNFQYGERLGECLSDIELGRLGLTCHFALDCLCDFWGTSVVDGGYLSDGYASNDVPALDWWAPNASGPTARDHGSVCGTLFVSGTGPNIGDVYVSDLGYVSEVLLANMVNE